jgi:hypothetical protein
MYNEKGLTLSFPTKLRFEKPNATKIISTIGIDFVLPSKLRFEKRNPKKIISSKLDYFFRISFYS